MIGFLISVLTLFSEIVLEPNYMKFSKISMLFSGWYSCYCYICPSPTEFSTFTMVCLRSCSVLLVRLCYPSRRCSFYNNFKQEEAVLTVYGDVNLGRPIQSIIYLQIYSYHMLVCSRWEAGNCWFEIFGLSLGCV